jgi:hypothetical protein
MSLSAIDYQFDELYCRLTNGETDMSGARHADWEKSGCLGGVFQHSHPLSHIESMWRAYPEVRQE